MAVKILWAKITVNPIFMLSKSDSMLHYLKVKIILGTWHLLNHEYGAVV